MIIKSFIHTADWHFWDKHIYSSNDSRFRDLIDNAHEVVYCAIENNIDMIIIAGDIFHVYNPDEKALREFTKVIKGAFDKDIMVRILVGNHDTNGVNHAMESIENVISDDGTPLDPSEYLLKIFANGVEWEDFDNVRFVYSPWKKDMPEQYNKAKEMRNFDKQYNVLVAHDCISGAVTSTGHTLVGASTEQMLSGWSYVALGDIHMFQQIGSERFAKSNKVYYCGSILRFNWGEKNDEKGFNLVELGKELEMSRVPLNDIGMVDYEIKADRISEMIDGVESIEELNGKSVCDSIIKVVIKGSIGFDTDVLMLKKILLDSGAIDVQMKEISDSKIEIGNKENIETYVGLDIDESIEKYIKGSDLDKEIKNRRIKSAKKIIEKIS